MICILGFLQNTYFRAVFSFLFGGRVLLHCPDWAWICGSSATGSQVLGLHLPSLPRAVLNVQVSHKDNSLNIPEPGFSLCYHFTLRDCMPWFCFVSGVFETALLGSLCQPCTCYAAQTAFQFVVLLLHSPPRAAHWDIPTPTPLKKVLFWDRVWVAQSGLELLIILLQPPRVQELQTCATMPG